MKAWLALPLLCGACAVGPDYRRPAVDSPDQFRGDRVPAAHSFAELPWTAVFSDPVLQDLVRAALAHNYDLRVALSRVEQARQLAAQARAGFFPQVDYTAFAAYGKNVGATGVPAPTGARGFLLAADASVSWEIDLWGRLRRLNEAAQAQFLASQEARRDVTVALIAQVAQEYFQLLALDRQLQIAREARDSFAGSLQIFNERLTGGVASKLETSSAEALLDSAEAAIPNWESQIALQENALSVLLGRAPGPMARGPRTLEAEALPEVPPGLPSALLERRPDVRLAEQQLRAANAQVGVATADFFPQLSLTGLLGQVSSQLSSFVSTGGVAWSAGGGLTGPIFRGGLIRARYRQALAVRDEAVLQYQATVLRALQEVSLNLILRDKLAQVREAQARAVAAYREATRVAMERYRVGNASYFEVLQEQQLLFPALNSLVQTELSQRLAVVQLYRALGGGWNE